ncbi:MAG: hypothetical protein LWW87_07185 [Geobacteraceae bacterium]|nr:hypothetical protein [Geobacteraceae bacterium]
MKPYANESDVLQIDGLTIENRTDRISLHGEIDITRDRQGLKAAQELMILIDATIKVLESEDHKGRLPEAIILDNTVTVENPFA